MIRVNRLVFDDNLNVGLGVQEGMDDLSYELVFCPIMEHVMSYFRNVLFVIELAVWDIVIDPNLQ